MNNKDFLQDSKSCVYPFTDNEKDCSFIETVYIKEYVDGIACEAFTSFNNLSSFVVSENNPLFSSYEGLIYTKDFKTLVLVPSILKDGLKIKRECEEIIYGAFSLYKGLSINLPSGIRTIYSNAFCYSTVQVIRLSNSVKNIYKDAFDNLHFLRKIECDKENRYFTSIDGVLYKKDLETLCVVPRGMSGSLVINEKVKTIFSDAFYHTNLTSVTFPPKVEELTNRLDTLCKPLFGHCKNLNEIIFSNKKLQITPLWFKDRVSFCGVKRDTQKAIAGYIYPSQISKKYKEEIVPLVLDILVNNKEKSFEWKHEWNKYIKRNIETFIKETSIFDTIFLRYLINEKLLNKTSTLLLVKKVSGNAEQTALILDYLNSSFSMEEIIEEKEKEIFLDENSVLYNKKYFSFRLKDDNTYKITSYKGTDEDVVVPSFIDGKEVSEIGSFCFSPSKNGIKGEEKEVRENIKSIIIPDTVKVIGDKAFYKCTKLKELKLSDNIKEIKGVVTKTQGKGFIYGCYSLTSITLPKNLEVIGESAFEGCKWIENIYVCENVKKIESFAFCGCENLRNINISEGVETINEFTFYNCKNLKKLLLPSSLKKICNNAFSYTHNLEVTMGEDVKEFEGEIAICAYSLKMKVKKDSISYYNCYRSGLDICLI